LRIIFTGEMRFLIEAATGAMDAQDRGRSNYLPINF